MTQQIVVWAILALQLAVLVLGDSHPVWRYSCQAVGSALVVYTFIRLRKTIRWRSATMVLFGVTILMITLTELLADFVPGVPKGVIRAFAVVMVASFIACFASMGWAVCKVILAGRPVAHDKRRELGR